MTLNFIVALHLVTESYVSCAISMHAFCVFYLTFVMNTGPASAVKWILIGFSAPPSISPYTPDMRYT